MENSWHCNFVYLEFFRSIEFFPNGFLVIIEPLWRMGLCITSLFHKMCHFHIIILEFRIRYIRLAVDCDSQH